MSSTRQLSFTVQPRILRHLGEQLIRDSFLAVFELVKNAYDADATTCSVELQYPEEPHKAKIIIEDDGEGMTPHIIENVWMVIATDFREKQKVANYRTPKFGRYPLGEKGLGRLAVHKLGRRIRITTRAAKFEEVVLEFNWSKLESAQALNKAGVTYSIGKPEIFKSSTHGTRIEVWDLRDKWTRKGVRNLQRCVNSLCSPALPKALLSEIKHAAPQDFHVGLEVLPDNGWLDGLLDPRQVQKCALYHASGWFENDQMIFNYTFTPPKGQKDKLSARPANGLKHPLQRRDGRKVVSVNLAEWKIGRVGFSFHIFDREPEVLHAVTDDIQGLRGYLNENGGIRVYREGIRVYDFGEPGNDWLNLDVRRVNRPVARVSNNQIIGALLLSGKDSRDLVEKSNREGFLESEAYDVFQDAVVSVLTQVEAERQKDQKLVRQFYTRGKGGKGNVFESIVELREELSSKGMLDEVEPLLNKVEKQLDQYRETMLRAAVPGLAFGVMIHGAEKLLAELVAVSRKSSDVERIRQLIEQLNQAVSRVGNLLRGSGTKIEKASFLVEQAFFNAEFRFENHGITAVNGLKYGDPDFSLKCSRRLIMATLNNLIDNSIYWLKFNKPRVAKKIYVGTTKEIEGGSCIVVADTGPGFQDDPEILTQPFFSRRIDDGMGLGLYLAADVMRLHDGRLLFPQREDVHVPPEFTGAIIALQFPLKS